MPLLPPDYIADVKGRIALDGRGVAVRLLERMNSRVVGRRAECQWHNDRDPSLTIYADGHVHCFSCGAHWTTIDLGALSVGCDPKADRDTAYVVGLKAIGDLLGVPPPESWSSPAFRGYTKPVVAPRPQEIPLAWDDQIAANTALIAAILAEQPTAEERAIHWLDRQRGIPRTISSAYGRYLWLDRAIIAKVRDRLRAEMGDLAVAAGLVMPSDNSFGQRANELLWWDDAVLIVSMSRGGGKPLAVRGRRMSADGPRYVASHRYGIAIDGAIRISRIIPFGMTAIDQSIRERKPLHIVEGGITALGAATIGHPAMAMGSRPGFADAADADGKSQTMMLEPLLDLLRACPAIVIAPDYDRKEESRATGLRYAWELARWLKSHGCAAQAEELPEIVGATRCGAQPDGAWLKDFADVAQDFACIKTQGSMVAP